MVEISMVEDCLHLGVMGADRLWTESGFFGMCIIPTTRL